MPKVNCQDESKSASKPCVFDSKVETTMCDTAARLSRLRANVSDSM